MKKLLTTMLALIFAASCLPAYTSDDIDLQEEEVTTSGSAFDDDVPFSSVYYEDEWFDIYSVLGASGNYSTSKGWYACLIVEDRATSHYWWASFHHYYTYKWVKKMVITTEVTVDDD